MADCSWMVETMKKEAVREGKADERDSERFVL